MNPSEVNKMVVTLNKYPPEKYNVLIPVTTMQVMNDMQRIIVNEVQLDPNPNGSDIYYEKNSGKYAISKVGGMKLSAAANISVVSTDSGMTDGCKRCVEMARATGHAQPCGTCPHRNDLAVTVAIRVPEPGGTFRIIAATREIDCETECAGMSDKQRSKFLQHRAAIAESKAFMRAVRSALGLSAGYELADLKKPFIIAHVVPNLDAPEIRQAVAQGYLQSMGMLFETSVSGLPEASRPALPAEVVRDDTPIESELYAEEEPFEEPPWEDEPAEEAEGYRCGNCHRTIVESSSPSGKNWTPEMIASYSLKKYDKVLCPTCQRKESALRKAATA